MADKTSEINAEGLGPVKVTLGNDGTAQIEVTTANVHVEAFSNMTTDTDKKPGVVVTRNEAPDKLGIGMTSVGSYGDRIVAGAQQWLADGKLDSGEAREAGILALELARHVVGSPLAVYNESDVSAPATPQSSAPRQR